MARSIKEVHTINFYPINEGAARRAKEMNSFSDYKEGSATAEYRAMVDKAAAIAEKQKSRVDPMYHEKIDHLLDTYARKLAENMNQGFAIDARVPSVMIAGPANFPVGKKEKQNRARDSNMEEWQYIQGLLDKIRSTGMGGISADDPAAIEKLQKKLDGLERSQLIMKEVNAYYRKHGKLDGCALLSPDQIEKLKASMELFQEYDVEFVSSTEKFDTSTPMGRAMLNICIVFAQLERETIQKRVTDAYYSRCLKGFHMSGQAPYGYQLEPTVVEGIRTKKMVADPVAADHVRLMFEMYAEPETSFGDITRYFEEHDIKIYGKSMFRTFLSQLLRNPVYAQADLELYEFFKSQGAAIVNDASDFAGTNGCYLYQGRDVKEDKDRCLKDQILVIAPHEALISSDTWLKCRKKLMANTTFQQGRKPKNTWLAGKIKCGHCGYALKATHVPNSTGYFRCTKQTENKGCPGCGKIRKEEFEQFIFSAMQEKFKDFQILHGREEKVNPKLTAYQVELAQVEAEIEKLLDTLTGANATLLAYANKKIEELDTRRQTISKAIAELSVETISPQQIKKLSYYLDNWDSIDFDDKRKAADGLISTIKATSDRVQIEWKI